MNEILEKIRSVEENIRAIDAKDEQEGKRKADELQTLKEWWDAIWTRAYGAGRSLGEGSDAK